MSQTLEEKPDRELEAPRRWRDRVAMRPDIAGGLAALAIASIVFSQFNMYSGLGRDSAIYVYGGQRFVHGVPPYASIMDPKGPMSSILCGFGVAVARLLGRNEIFVIRAEFAALSIVAVLGIYLLALELWHSVVGGVVAATVFTSFKMFAYDALGGPDGHTPGVVFLIFALWLTVRRQWYWAGVLASLAFYSWQPLFLYPLVVLACAAVWSPGRRLRAVGWNIAGAATPFVVLLGYFAASGYPGKFFEGTFLFPLTGTYRPPVTFGARLHWIFTDIPAAYGFSAYVLYAGLLLLLAFAVRSVVTATSGRRAALLSPIVLLLMLSLLADVGYVLYDYIGWTHAFPLLPYGALGFAAGVAYLFELLSHRPPRVLRSAGAALLVASAVLTVTCAVKYYEPSGDTELLGEEATACAVQRSIAPGTTLWVIDQPVPLVLLHRVNPDNYPYVGSGLANWKVAHTRGGFAAWTAQIEARASIVLMDDWREEIPVHDEMKAFLETHGYTFGYIGLYKVWVTPAARARMRAESIRLTRKRQDWPLTTTGGSLHSTHCRRATN